VVIDVPGIETRIAVVRRFVSALAFLLATGGVAQVDVIEVQTPRLFVMIGRFMDMGRAGHEAEGEREDAAAQREDLTHPTEFTRTQGSAPLDLSIWNLQDTRGESRLFPVTKRPPHGLTLRSASSPTLAPNGTATLGHGGMAERGEKRHADPRIA